MQVWQQACLDLSQILGNKSDGQRRSLASVAMAEWFQARAGRFRQLGLKDTHGSFELRTAMTCMLLSTQAVSLTHLSVDVTSFGLRGSDLCILGIIRGLEALDVHVFRPGLDDRGAAMLRVASRLTALQQLDVGYRDDTETCLSPDDIKLPRCLELAELRSVSLTDMCVAIASGAGDVLRLSGLPNFTQMPPAGRSAQQR